MAEKRILPLIGITLVMGIILLSILVFPGCSGNQNNIDLEQVQSVTAEQSQLLPEDDHELIEQLITAFNQAKEKRTAGSGPSTHLLIISTDDGAVYNLYRINENLVEVGMRQDDIRRKFFLESAELAEMILLICEGRH